jgi:hypothetical protein
MNGQTYRRAGEGFRITLGEAFKMLEAYSLFHAFDCAEFVNECWAKWKIETPPLEEGDAGMTLIEVRRVLDWLDDEQ